MTQDTPPTDLSRLVALERAEARRQAFEEAANLLEMKDGNEVYRRAYRIAADFIRTALIANKRSGAAPGCKK